MASTLKSPGFDTLNNDTIGLVLQFVGKKSYATFGGINQLCRNVYVASEMPKETFLFGYAPLSVILDQCRDWGWQTDSMLGNPLGLGVVHHNRNDVLQWALQEQHGILRGICEVAIEEGRFDILNKVSSNVDKSFLEELCYLGGLSRYATTLGRLGALKWMYNNGIVDQDSIDLAKEAASEGHLPILIWLKDIGCNFDEEVPSSAANNGHLHVLKWLREQRCPWNEWTFVRAVRSGNLDMLEWLKKEGCPWKEDGIYFEMFIRSGSDGETWLRDNGYNFQRSNFDFNSIRVGSVSNFVRE